MNENKLPVIKLGKQLDRQRRLLRRIQSLYEVERREWARLLHDDFGQSLAAIKSFAYAIKNDTENNSETREIADIILNTASEMYVSSYDLMRGLRSGFIEDMGLLDSVQVCLENSRLPQQGIKVSVQTEGEVEMLGSLLDVLLLRIVQESLSGIIRSSNPEEMLIFIGVRQHCLTERRKNIRAADTDMAGLPLIRDVIELQINSKNGPDKPELDTSDSIFHRTRDYVEALGGDYTVKQLDQSVINIQINMDITELIEENLIADLSSEDISFTESEVVQTVIKDETE